LREQLAQVSLRAVRVPAEAKQCYILCPLNGTLPTAAFKETVV